VLADVEKGRVRDVANLKQLARDWKPKARLQGTGHRLQQKEKPTAKAKP
jgi:hypothetical protein